jgi:hypothetical protein
MLTTVNRETGGIVTKLLIGLFTLAVVGSVVAYLFLRNDTPLALAPAAAVGVNPALQDGGLTDDGAVTMVPGGQVYLATVVRNDGRFPVTLEGLGELGEIDAVPYIPVELRLGDGATPDPEGTAVFSAQTLDPGEGIGVLVTYAPNPVLKCQILPEEAVGKGTTIDGFPLAARVYGVTFTQDLQASDPFARIAPVTQEECEAAFADAE